MSFATQEEAVEFARSQGGRVHVYGAREGGDFEGGEVVCEGGAPPEGTSVVYHPAAVRLTGGGYACSRCGESEDERRPPRLAS